MEQIKDTEVSRLVKQIGEHYRSNISNRYLRPVLRQFQLDETTWGLIEVLTEKVELYKGEGFYLDEMYRQIAACARLVEECKKFNMRNRMSATLTGKSDKLLHEIAASNFSSNLQIFADLLAQLYLHLADLDKKQSGNRQPVFSKMGELHNVGHLLVGVEL